MLLALLLLMLLSAVTGNHFWTERVKNLCCVGKHTLGGQRGSRSELENLFEFLHALAGRGAAGERWDVKIRI